MMTMTAAIVVIVIIVNGTDGQRQRPERLNLLIVTAKNSIQGWQCERAGSRKRVNNIIMDYCGQKFVAGQVKFFW